jgi:hypothetical protein
MACMSALIADPAGMGQKWPLLVGVVVAYPPARIAHILLF